MSENRKTVFVVGLGPGGGQFLTVQAQSALQQAEVLCGYTVYIDLVRPLYPEKECLTAAAGRWIPPGQAGTWRWSAPAMPGSTAWQALFWSWPRRIRMLMWRSCPA